MIVILRKKTAKIKVISMGFLVSAVPPCYPSQQAAALSDHPSSVVSHPTQLYNYLDL